jgi:hypothetical protein
MTNPQLFRKYFTPTERRAQRFMHQNKAGTEKVLEAPKDTHPEVT